MSETILQLEDITVNFDGFKAIQGVNFSVDEGEIRFLIGPNGAGKTTLLDVICGRVKPTTGKVIFKDKGNIVRKKDYEIARMGINRKFQVPSVFTGLTVFENMELSMVKHKNLMPSIFSKVTKDQRDIIYEYLELLNLKDKADYIAGTLAHGEKQWLEIGMQMIQEPSLLLLDEPVAGMGKKETVKTGELLKKIAKRCSIIVVEHDMDFVRDFSSKVTVMHEGKILCEGPMEEVQNDKRVIEVYLGRGGEKCA